MTIAPPRLFAAAFAGFILWIGAAASPARAEDVVTAIARPAERLGDGDACRVVSPRFEPQGRQRPPTEAARFAGGATLRSLVATPCARAPKGFDV
jgi:hypothetical protein